MQKSWEIFQHAHKFYFRNTILVVLKPLNDRKRGKQAVVPQAYYKFQMVYSATASWVYRVISMNLLEHVLLITYTGLTGLVIPREFCGVLEFLETSIRSSISKGAWIGRLTVCRKNTVTFHLKFAKV